MEYEFFEQNSVIFLEGAESNNKMFIIIHGQVAIVKADMKNAFRLEFLKQQQEKIDEENKILQKKN